MNGHTKKVFLPLVLTLVPFVAYLSTICPTVYLGDSGELTAAAYSLGIPHNSGYPLYAILGKLFCLIPIGNIGFRMNLMSSCFAALTVWLVYSLIVRITSSKISGFTGTLILAFTPVFWLQTVSSEVYTLHIFFITLLIRLLWWWDERRDFFILLIFVFITGVSFCNHLQTVMLAPAVLFIILSGDKNSVLNLKHFFILFLLFFVALSIYLYLPLRTSAGAAIHWGDPDSVERFLAHVSGTSHRKGYVLNKTLWEYIIRTKDALFLVWSQFGIFLVISIWGWLKLGSRRWRTFCLMVVVFDFIYTVFLNTISLKATAFNLPSCILLGILMGVGISDVLKMLERLKTVGTGTHKFVRIAICIIPVIVLFLNYGFCNQSRNYTGYEEAMNTFRTVGNGDTLILMGDNYFFPIVYARLVERMREDVIIYDRLNIVFKYPNLENLQFVEGISWDDRRDNIEMSIARNKGQNEIFYAVSSPLSVKLQEGYSLIQAGILNRVIDQDSANDKKTRDIWWKYHATESFYDDFERDFMNREVCGHYFFFLGKSFLLSGRERVGIQSMQKASTIGYDSAGLHTSMAIFFSERGFSGKAQKALEKALIYNEDLSYVYYIWGYYYDRKREYNRAIASLQKAIALKPTKYAYYNYLGQVFYEVGRKEEAFLAFGKSLSIKNDQPEIKNFLENGD
jgi:tetratricopeptide (TPR) repeat protein